MVKIIAINAVKGTGKDYFYNLIKKNYKNVCKLSFAEQLKIYYIDNFKNKIGKEAEIILGIKNFSDLELNKQLEIIEKLKNNRNSDVRLDLQRIATEKRQKDPDYWVKLAFRKLDNISEDKCQYVIITDLRFLNEAKAVVERWWLIISFRNYSYQQNIVEEAKKDDKIKRIFQHESELLWFYPIPIGLVFDFTPDYVNNSKYINDKCLLNIFKEIEKIFKHRKKNKLNVKLTGDLLKDIFIINQKIYENFNLNI